MNENQKSPTPQKFFVDLEPQPLNQPRMPVRKILEQAGHVPPEDFCLLEFEPQGAERRYDDLNQEVELRENLNLAAVYRGPTPVS